MLSEFNREYLLEEYSRERGAWLARFLKRRWAKAKAVDVWRGGVVVLTYDPADETVEVADMFCQAEPEKVSRDWFFELLASQHGRQNRKR